MSEPLGLSVGTTNLVALRADRAPVSCPSPPADRRAGMGGGGHVAMPVDAVATALDALADAVGYGAPVVVAVPAYWDPMTIDRLRTAVAARSRLGTDRMPPTFVTDVAATVTALAGEPRLPGDGIVALCDVGGGGTSITLVNAGAGFAPISGTVRHDGFAGDRIDRAIADHLLPRLPRTPDQDGDRDRLREQCRAAKEQLSTQPSTAVPAELSRAELEQIIAEPLAGLVGAVTATLSRDQTPASRLTAVALTGGGAHIPAIAAVLSARLGVPVITPAQPSCTAAAGALMMAGGRLPELNVSTPSVIVTPIGTAPIGTTPSAQPTPPAAPSRAPSAASAPARRRRPAVLIGLAVAVVVIVAGLAYALSRPAAPDSGTPAGTSVTAPPNGDGR